MKIQSIKLSPQTIDSLREIGNIGCGHAATALSTLTNQKIMMSVPAVDPISIEEVLDVIAVKAEELAAFITSSLQGDLRGRFNLILPSKSAETLVQILLDQPIAKLDLLNAMESSLLVETGNIMLGSFVTAMADMLGLSLQCDVPRLTMDMVGASLQSVAVEVSLEIETAFVIHTQFISHREVMVVHLLLTLDHESTELLLDKLDEMS
ncbi:chemotaxis protein CheC [Acidobacteria bacterium AH-259-A15]|nr:chemotaxis protein CheC [Acidobacteria bacterium AH-259-A15]